jgi:hemerythrin-like domain-containing protein
MAKRHISIVPLARDHHEALLLAVRLQQGNQALLKIWSHDPDFQARNVVTFFDQHLAQHFRAEEEVLFPLAATHILQARDMVQKLIEDHKTLTLSVGRFRSGTAKSLEPELVAFGKLLEDHVRLEDRVLFPLVEQAPETVLDELQQAMVRYYPGEVT